MQVDDENIYLSSQGVRGSFSNRFNDNSLSLTDNDDEEYPYPNNGDVSCGSSIDVDEFISCCESDDLSQDQILFPIVTDLSKESDTTILRQNKSPRSLFPEDDLLLQDEEISTEQLPFSRYIRAGDLNVYDAENQNEGTEVVLSLPPSDQGVTQGTKLDFLELTNKNDSNSQEAQYHATVIGAMNAMTEMGLMLATLDDDEQNDNSSGSGISWKAEGATGKTIEKIMGQNQGSKWHTNPDSVKLLEEEVLTWSGSISKGEKHESAYASKIPLFRGRGVIPAASPLQLTQLILDSSRVKLYNKFTNGRDDLCVFQNLDDVDGRFGDGCLKVVESKTNVPLSSRTLKMMNMLHAKPITLHSDELNRGVNDSESQMSTNDECNPNGFVIVSRSVYTDDDLSEEREKKVSQAVPGSKNELIWGINILREVPGEPNKTDLITVSQANSSAVPSFLSHKVCHRLICICIFFFIFFSS